VTTSLVYSAAARGVRLSAVSSELEGEMDVRGALGVSDEHRNGFSRIRMTVTISGDAPPEKLREVVMRGRQRSAVRHGHQRGPGRAGRRHRATFFG
jgi:uncharacterized OsmC-like protein